MKRKKTDVEEELGIEIEEAIEPDCSIMEQVDTMLAYGSTELGLNRISRESEAENRVKNEMEKKI